MKAYKPITTTQLQNSLMKFFEEVLEGQDKKKVDLAKSLKCTKSNISQLFNGKKKLNLNNFVKIVNALEIKLQL